RDHIAGDDRDYRDHHTTYKYATHFRFCDALWLRDLDRTARERLSMRRGGRGNRLRAPVDLSGTQDPFGAKQLLERPQPAFIVRAAFDRRVAQRGGCIRPRDLLDQTLTKFIPRKPPALEQRHGHRECARLPWLRKNN